MKLSTSLLTCAVILAAAAARAQEAPGEAALGSAFAAARAVLAAGAARAMLASPRATAPKGAGADAWNAILAKAEAGGTYSPENEDIPATMGLQRVVGAAAADHVADYFNLWGGKDANGVFQAGSASFVSEDWRIIDGDWNIDQWIFQLNMDGSIAQPTHNVLVETMDGQVLQDDGDPLPNTDPRIAQEYQSLITFWTAYPK
jgi:hypothetical protein